MILIAGCNGHVGKEIVRRTLERRIPARCLDVKPLELDGSDTSALEIIAGDITDRDTVLSATQGVSAVLFAVGLKRQSKELTHEKVEHGGIKNVVHAARENGVGHILYISALGVGKDVPATSLMAKWNAEQTLIASGIDYTIFRPSGYFVDFQEHFAPKIRATGSFTLIGDGSARLQPLDPADLAEAFIQSIDNERAKNRIFKISGPEVFTLAEIVMLVGKVLECDVRLKKVPRWLMNAVFSFMALVTGSRGGKDFLYRMSRDSVCSDEEMREVSEAFTITFKRLEPWLRERLGTVTS